MRIGVVIDRWDPARGGAERALALLTNHLVGAGHEAHVFTLAAADGAPGTVVRLKRPMRPRGAMEIAFARDAMAAARAASCDAVIGVRHMEEADVYWPHGGLHAVTLAAGEASKGGVGGTISRALHRISPKHRAFVGLEDRLLAGRRARAIWCVSQMVRDEIASRYPQAADLLEVHANGVDLDRFHPRLRRERRNAFLAKHGADPAHPVVLFLGGNWRLKGFDVLCAALRDVPPPWTLIGAGSGHARVQAGDAVSGGGRVILLPQQDARDLFGAADLLVQPTFRDPCSLATLEALAAGVPVITTRNNGARDAITPDRAGTVIDAPDAALLAPAIRHWLQTVAVEAVRTTEVAVEARQAAERRPLGTWLDGLTASLGRLAPTT